MFEFSHETVNDILGYDDTAFIEKYILSISEILQELYGDANAVPRKIGDYVSTKFTLKYWILHQLNVHNWTSNTHN